MNGIRPSWLPDLVSVNGEWNQMLARLHAIFERDFVLGGCTLRGMPVWWNRTKTKGEPYEEGFWHLITKTDQASGERLLDPRRAERLPWCNPTLTHSNDPVVKVWDYREKNGKLGTYVWIEDWDYVVVIQTRQHNRGPVAFLLTAFHVDFDSSRRRLAAKYARRETP